MRREPSPTSSGSAPRCVAAGLDRSDTSEQFLYRWSSGGTPQDGGRLFGGTIYSKLTVHDDYDNKWPNGASLYPCSDGGQIYVRDRECRNFTIEGFRTHGGWDPIRLGGKGGRVPDTTPLIENIRVK